MLDADKCIWVTFQKEGIHCYPVAGTDPRLSEVSFLEHPHRHIFHFKVWVEVFHDDRDIEFILLKRELEGRFSGNENVNYKSCEMLAQDVIDYITYQYPGREVAVEVSEDGENGAIVRFNPHKV